MSSARIHMPPALADLLRSELDRAIYEAALWREDEIIARRYLIDKMPQIDIASEVGYERSTISRRLPHIFREVERAARRLGYIV